jgi:hypothetical protein
MSDVQSVTVYLSHPTGPNDLGQVTFGFFKVDDDVLIMTDEKGNPMRRINNGEIWSQKLGPDDNPRSVAGALTKDIRRELHGGSDFYRRLTYPDIKKVVPV